ncbi:MAG: phosphoenolpyruvate--protein phosphotransferase [Candidatus Gygaella obscura]|nr:phosphoenolpyruvate--protein phosphotransferase [Candidatus Gygaella obscura]
MEKLKGISAAPGIGIGSAHLAGKEEFNVVPYKVRLQDVPVQIQLFEDALIKTRKEIIELQDKISKDLGREEAEIFDAHLLVLEDRILIEEVILQLKKEHLNVAYVFQEVIKKYIRVFSRIEDEYLKERISDINDVGRRVIKNLLGEKGFSLQNKKEQFIVVAHDLSPSDTATMHNSRILGFITDIGSKTSHTAIMAKSLEIPSVVGLEVATTKIKNDDQLIVDGFSGLVIINPDKATLKAYRKKEEEFKRINKKFISLKSLPAKTTDGKRVRVVANIEFPEDIPSLVQHGAEGIGLYRTEYFYMNRTTLPTENEQFEAYKFVAQAVSPYSIVIRTLDLGGDKFLSQLAVPREMSAFLGWRAIRFCLAQPDMFKAQLRAILRASKFGKLKLMYPMISGVDELRQANKMLSECKIELKKKHIEFDEELEVGVMIEVPAAAMTADILAKEADFFSIGTNDLIQYSLAVDRTNEKVAYLYEPAHPAVLRMVKKVIDDGHNAGIWVGMCGEMAGDPYFSLLLLGLGLDEFSMPPAVVPQIKQVVRSFSFSDAQDIARKAMEHSTAKEVEEFTKKFFNKTEFKIF